MYSEILDFHRIRALNAGSFECLHTVLIHVFIDVDVGFELHADLILYFGGGFISFWLVSFFYMNYGFVSVTMSRISSFD